MPDISQMKSSQFLSAGDFKEGPQLAVMLNVTQENVAKKGEPEELKWCLHFSNIEKPLVLNQINMQLIAQVAQSTSTDDWAGKKIVIFFDPSVSFGGKLTGGLRVRAPRIKPPVPPAIPPAPRPAAHVAPPPPAPPPVAVPDPNEGNPAYGDDDVPF